jgi:response regulator of citrate/malate metabolism
LDPNQRQLELLLLDDSQSDLDAQRRTIESCKLLNPVRTFKDVEQAAGFLREGRKDDQAPRYLMFVDLLMKPSDGLDFLRIVKEEKLAPGAVIVMLSGLTDTKMLHDGYQLGALTFLIKPLTVQDVMGLLTALKHSIRVQSEAAGNRLVWFAPAHAMR